MPPVTIGSYGISGIWLVITWVSRMPGTFAPSRNARPDSVSVIRTPTTAVPRKMGPGAPLPTNTSVLPSIEKNDFAPDTA